MTASLGLFGILLFAFNLCFSGATLIELPATPEPATLLFHPGCVIRYNPETLQPDWVAYRLTAAEARATEASRADRFFPDPELALTAKAADNPFGSVGTIMSADNGDYTRSGYDRGHMAPAADMKFSEGSMIASFFFSNVSPQNPGLNRGLWSKLEASVRKEAERCGAVYVVSGPVFYSDRVTRDRVFIGDHRVRVPDAFFKVLLVKNESETRCIAFIVPNRGVAGDPLAFASSVDDAERITGFDFFYLLGDSVETAIEKSYDPSLWFEP